MCQDLLRTLDFVNRRPVSSAVLNMTFSDDARLQFLAEALDMRPRESELGVGKRDLEGRY